jgi:hypothetical protein
VTQRARQYEIRVRGRLDDAAEARFADFTDAVQTRETVLRGPIVDQAELRGILARLQDLGLELLEIRRLTPPGP